MFPILLCLGEIRDPFNCGEVTDIKKIGLIGGVGWPATVLYYSGLCKAAARQCHGGSPPMVIESLNMQDTLSKRGTANDPQSWEAYDAIFRDALTRLENAGCDVAAEFGAGEVQ